MIVVVKPSIFTKLNKLGFAESASTIAGSGPFAGGTFMMVNGIKLMKSTRMPQNIQ